MTLCVLHSQGAQGYPGNPGLVGDGGQVVSAVDRLTFQWDTVEHHNSPNRFSILTKIKGIIIDCVSDITLNYFLCQTTPTGLID